MMLRHLRTPLPLLLCLVQTASAADKPAESRLLYEARIPDGPAVLIGEIGIAGKTYPLMVDTGAESALVTDSSIAAQFGGPVSDTRIEYTDFKGRNYRIPEATVGGLTLPAAVAPAYDLSSMRGALGLPPFCILGWEALKGRNLELDHDLGKFRISNGAGKPPSSWTTLPVVFEHRAPSIHAPLGDKDYTWSIDTGFNDTILVSKPNFQRLVSDGFIRERNAGSITGVDGAQVTRTGYFTKGSLLGIDLSGLNVTTEPRGFEVLGMTFFRKLNFIISGEPSRFSYSVRKNPVHPISEQLMLGIFFTYDRGQAVVTRIKPGSNAEKAGLKPEDRVVKIDEVGDEPLDAFKMFDLCRKHAGQPVTLRLQRAGQPLTIKLPLTPIVDAWDREPVGAK